MATFAAQPQPLKIPKLESNLQLTPEAARGMMINLSGQPTAQPANPGMAALSQPVPAATPQVADVISQLPTSPGLEASKDFTKIDPSDFGWEFKQMMDQDPEWQKDREVFNRAFAAGMGGQTDWQSMLSDTFSADKMKSYDAKAQTFTTQGRSLQQQPFDEQAPERFGGIDTSSAKAFFSDPRIMSTLIGGLMAMAAGESPADALLWGAVGAGASQKALDDQYTQASDQYNKKVTAHIAQQNADTKAFGAQIDADEAQIKRDKLSWDQNYIPSRDAKDFEIKWGNMRAQYIKSLAAGKDANTREFKAYADQKASYLDRAVNILSKQYVDSKDVYGNSTRRQPTLNESKFLANEIEKTESTGQQYVYDPNEFNKRVENYNSVLSSYQGMNEEGRKKLRAAVDARYKAQSISEFEKDQMLETFDEIDKETE